MADKRAWDWAVFVQNLLKTKDMSPFTTGDIVISKFPFHKRPSKGIVISPLDESEGVGLNDRDDIKYSVQVTFIMPKIHQIDGVSDMSNLRTIIRETFNRKRLGFHAQEMICTAKHESIFIPKAWSDWNIDASVMKVTTMIREIRQ